MAGGNTAVFAIYLTYSKVERGVEDLQATGFRSTDISVLFPENAGAKDFAHQKDTKAPEGATAAGVSGAVVGGTLGWLAGIGAIAIPGVGPLIAAGPLLSALAGVGLGGAVAGIAGGLIGMGIPEYEAKQYERRVRRGAILISIHCDNQEWAKRAKGILKRTGAQEISSVGESSADYSVSDRPLPRAASQGRE